VTAPLSLPRRILADAGYAADAAHNVWVRDGRDTPAFAYSDGDEVEERIAAAIKGSDDVSLQSEELRRFQVDWPSIYHLSATRANLLRSISNVFKGASVLEIGAGCGAITRFLGEAGARVVALEGSPRRAAIAASRCRDLPDVAVVNERFDAFAPEQRFDVVTLIGVLEYSRMYTAGDDPIQETLRRARDLLTDDGVLIIAIENQLGLKYFAGIPEDHIGRSMAGIQDDYTDRTVVTFGKAELERRLASAGFARNGFALPFPDYKLPLNIVLPSGINHSGFDAATLGAQGTRADRQVRFTPLFSIGRTFDVIGRNGLLADMANSFLIIAGKSAASPSFETIAPGILAEQYSTERQPAYNKAARFREMNGTIAVERFRLAPDATATSRVIAHHIEDEAYLRGKRWTDRLDAILSRRGWTLDEVAVWFDVWLRAILREANLEGPVTLEQPVPGILMDATPGNLIVDSDGNSTFFDLEWSLLSPTTLGYLAFRAIKLSLGQLTAVAMPKDPQLLHTDTLLRVILRRCGFIVTTSHVQQYLDTEAAFVAEVLGELTRDIPLGPYKMESLAVLPDVAALLSHHASATADALRSTSFVYADSENLQGEADQLKALLAAAEAELTEIRSHALRSDVQLSEEIRKALNDARIARTDAISKLELAQQETLGLQRIVSAHEEELRLVKRSLSWKLTAPLRWAKRFASRVRGGARRRLASGAKRMYEATPLAPRHKRAVKGSIFRVAAPFLRGTAAFQRWEAHERTSGPIRPGGASSRSTAATMVDTSVGNVLWQADGVREWSDYPEVRDRIDTETRALRASRQASPMPQLDYSRIKPEEVAGRIGLPATDNPRVTILVPVYNHLSTTLECLASIVASMTPDDPSFEVLVANDASTDATAQVLASVRNLRIVNQPSNLGFLLNCNTAAAQARGDILILLNNDVQVTTGWLGKLVACLESDERIGAVGPRILYPNGWLQEAGTRLHRDGSAEMLGLNDQADLPRYQYTRDVDYCSGACLALRRADFDRLGGFDTGYAPAYCEDSDLCMRLRAEGRRIVYCADTEVVHQLSTTSDAMPSEYKLSCIARNLDRFATKWREDLDSMNEVRTIAFYLPQFHPIAENDVWWGPGFTEWTNVTKARPNYVGHYQPRLPADLGYYDLRLTEVMEKQAELARRYGVGGFCFYYYWFAGKRLLERPIEKMLETGKPDFPFCLCWANENWTRRWDGQENEILMAQNHSDQDDLAVIHDLMRYFRSPNYIRIDDKPLILVYRITLFPDFARTASIWREECRRAGMGEIYIAQVESFELAAAGKNPKDMGCDAAVEFPPQGMAQPIDLNAPLLNPQFQGAVADYRDIAVRYATRELPAYKRFMGVMPGWDNTARRQDNSYSFTEATPGSFQAWMETTVARTKQQFSGDERLVFINAWNEWAEGTYLEPDRRFGHTFLEAHRNALDADYLARNDKYSLG
jgi:GT2 family glycosyltransferase/2-polyprenyl-3-methyl-5-hydroxy-6-metoxy-1,4-benzoquinol methylase